MVSMSLQQKKTAAILKILSEIEINATQTVPLIGGPIVQMNWSHG